jgi:hypothetical protein
MFAKKLHELETPEDYSDSEHGPSVFPQISFCISVLNLINNKSP